MKKLAIEWGDAVERELLFLKNLATKQKNDESLQKIESLSLLLSRVKVLIQSNSDFNISETTLVFIANFRLTCLGLLCVILTPFPLSDLYKKRVLDADQYLKWNLGLNEDYSISYKPKG